MFLLDCITQQSINLKIMLNNYSGHRFLDIVRNWVEWGSDMSADKAQHWFTQPSLVLAPSTKWLLWPWNTQYWKKFRNAWWRNSDLVKKKANSPWLQPSKMKVENDSYRITGELTSAKQLECFPSPWRNKLRENQLTDQKKKNPNQTKKNKPQMLHSERIFLDLEFRLRLWVTLRVYKQSSILGESSHTASEKPWDRKNILSIHLGSGLFLLAASCNWMKLSAAGKCVMDLKSASGVYILL